MRSLILVQPLRIAAPLLLLASCATTKPAVDDGVKLRGDTKASCTAHCEAMGMQLGAIVLIQNSAGCVCEPADEWADDVGPSAARSGATAAAGGALVAFAHEQERQREDARRQDEARQDEERRQHEKEERRSRDEERERRDAEQRARERSLGR